MGKLQKAYDEHQDYHTAVQDVERWILQQSFRVMSHNSLPVVSMELTKDQQNKHAVSQQTNKYSHHANLHVRVLRIYNKLRVIRSQWDLKNNSDYAKKNALVLVSLTRKFVRITRVYCITLIYVPQHDCLLPVLQQTCSISVWKRHAASCSHIGCFRTSVRVIDVSRRYIYRV